MQQQSEHNKPIASCLSHRRTELTAFGKNGTERGRSGRFSLSKFRRKKPQKTAKNRKNLEKHLLLGLPGQRDFLPPNCSKTLQKPPKSTTYISSKRGMGPERRLTAH